ncbi:MAG TPA: hypothetical protein VK424_03270 [Thermoplasmata archaeon]|nr:hypothetical protein [Thermoplasmata archaeon]
MSAPEVGSRFGRAVGPTFALLAAGLLGFALLGTLPLFEGLLVAVAGLGFAAALRQSGWRGLHAYAPVGPLVSLGILAVASTPSAIPALYGGATALAFLLWLSEDPDRLAGGPGRAIGRLLLPGIGLALAWTSSFLLPGGDATVGIAAALLGGVLVLVALFLRAPEILERDATATS